MPLRAQRGYRAMQEGGANAEVVRARLRVRPWGHWGNGGTREDSMSSGVVGLFRFGRSDHIDQFCALGRLFMKPLRHFRELEGDELRGDRDEALCWTYPSDQVQLQVQLDGSFHTIPGISGPFNYSRDLDQTVNVFCMYALQRRDPQCLVDPRVCSFGDTYALLLDGDEFLRRVQQTPLPSGQRLEWHLVEYVDPGRHTGHMGPFRKFTRFDYQSEFRIAMFPGTGADFCLDVGELSDIAITGPSERVNRRIRIE